VVLVDEPRRYERLAKLGWTREEIQARLQAQMPQEEKARRADYTIDNSGSLEATRREASRVMNELKSLARRKPSPKE
jgi:dephospho-CoA kinase